MQEKFMAYIDTSLILFPAVYLCVSVGCGFTQHVQHYRLGHDIPRRQLYHLRTRGHQGCSNI